MAAIDKLRPQKFCAALLRSVVLHTCHAALPSEMVMVGGYELVEGQPAVRCVAQKLDALLGEVVGPLHLVLSLLPLGYGDVDVVTLAWRRVSN